MRSGGLKLLNYFQTLDQPHKFKIPVHIYFGFLKIEKSKKTVFYIVFKT